MLTIVTVTVTKTFKVFSRKLLAYTLRSYIVSLLNSVVSVSENYDTDLLTSHRLKNVQKVLTMSHRVKLRFSATSNLCMEDCITPSH